MISILVAALVGLSIGFAAGEIEARAGYSRMLQEMRDWNAATAQDLITLQGQYRTLLGKLNNLEALELEPDEQRERVPKRLREPDNRTFWS